MHRNPRYEWTRWGRMVYAAVMLALVLALIWLLSGCSHTVPRYSTSAQAADALTTAWALSDGAIESNALVSGAIGSGAGAAAIVAAKLALPYAATYIERDACRGASIALFGVGAGAAAGNLLVIAGVSSGGFLLAIPLSFAAGWAYWNWGGDEKDCTYAPSLQPVAKSITQATYLYE